MSDARFNGSPANTDRLWMLACAVISVVAILLTNPFAEASFNDDWAYALSVREMANGSGVHFHGWETSLNFIQVAWAVLWVKVFGYSLTVIRLSTLAMTAGCAATLYSLLRSCNVTPLRSVIGTCVITLSPVFVSVGTSFMTDVPSLFFLLLIIHNYVISTKHADKAFLGWASFATVTAWVLGFNRQTLWFIPLTVLPCLAYMYPQAKKWRPALLSLWIGSIVVIVAAFKWQAQQPYATPDSAGPLIAEVLASPVWSVVYLVKFILTFFLLTLPVFVFSRAFWDAGKQLPRILRWGIGAASVALSVAGYIAPQKYQHLFAPWNKLGNMVTTQGVLYDDMLIGERPAILSPVVLFALNFAVFSLTFYVLSVAIHLILRNRRDLKSYILRSWSEAPPAIQFLLTFCLLYTVLLLPRVLSENAFDRYQLPMMVLTVLCIFRADSKRSESRDANLNQKWGTALLLIWGVFGIAITHDYVAMMRNQADMTAWLEKQGIARSKISAGWEYDCTTQVLLTGFLNDPRVINPPGAHRDLPAPKPVYVGDIVLAGGWWTYATPDVHPEYFVTLNMSIPGQTPIKTQQYRTWLPLKMQRIDAYFLPGTYQKMVGETTGGTTDESREQ
jgi:hypothetical protein